MDDVDGHSLQGFASMVVLCCRYVESVEQIVNILNDFIVLGHDLINPGRLGDHGTRLSLPEKALMSNFVRATIDSDANSQQAASVMSWMAELSSEVGVSTRLNFATGRSSDYNRSLITRLTGFLSPESVKVKGGGTADDFDDGLPREPSQVIHHTLSMGTASIALAAAANGADVSLQCITSEGIKTIPQRSTPAAFVVRLWLRQPPPQISNFLSYAEAKTKATAAGSTDDSDTYHSVVFGGNLEVALNVAREIGYGAKELERGEHSKMRQRIQDLWMNGQQRGKALWWPISSSSQLRFELNPESDHITIPPHVDPLLDMLNATDKRLSPLGRTLALIVHDIYRYSEYPPDQAAEFSTAMILVSIAMAIGSLHSMTHAPVNDKDQYALELGTVRRNGALRELLPLALNGQGITHEVLLWTTATLWGGASSESQGGVVIDRRMIGIVAPHCTMILDILRDPIEFARPPMCGRLLTMCRGSMPLLARNPRSGFMMAADLGHRSRSLLDCGRNALSCTSLPESLHEAEGGPSKNELIITLEPEVVSGSSQSIFCGWYGGDLVFELDPLVTFCNLLKRQHAINMPEQQLLEGGNVKDDFPDYKRMLLTDLISHGLFEARNGVVIFNTYSDPAWALAAAGCAKPGKAVYHYGHFDISRCTLGEGDAVIYFWGRD